MSYGSIFASLISKLVKLAIVVAVLYIVANQYTAYTGKDITWNMLIGKESIFPGKEEDGCSEYITDGDTEVKRGRRFKDDEFGNGVLCLDRKGHLKNSQTGKYFMSVHENKFDVSEYAEYMEGLTNGMCAYTSNMSNNDNIYMSKDKVKEEMNRLLNNEVDHVLTKEEIVDVYSSECDTSVNGSELKKYLYN